MKSELVEAIHRANREFQEFIDEVLQNGAKVVDSRGALRRLAKVDLRLKHISKCLATSRKSDAQPPEAAYEIHKYRETLKSLRNVMETLQFSLLAERARMENLQANMSAARAWAASVRELS